MFVARAYVHPFAAFVTGSTDEEPTMIDTVNASPRSGLETTTKPAAHTRPAYQAFLILYAGFTALPILAGADKFLHLLVNWDQYLAPSIAGLLPVSGHTFMLAVGVIEMA